MGKKKEANGEVFQETTNGNFVPTMTPGERKKAFAAWEAANRAVEKAKEELEAALSARSDVVKQIAEGAGRGTFSYKGQILTVMCRRGTRRTSNETWYFKGPSNMSDLIEV